MRLRLVTPSLLIAFLFSYSGALFASKHKGSTEGSKPSKAAGVEFVPPSAGPHRSRQIVELITVPRGVNVFHGTTFVFRNAAGKPTNFPFGPGFFSIAESASKEVACTAIKLQQWVSSGDAPPDDWLEARRKIASSGAEKKSLAPGEYKVYQYTTEPTPMIHIHGVLHLLAWIQHLSLHLKSNGVSLAEFERDKDFLVLQKMTNLGISGRDIVKDTFRLNPGTGDWSYAHDAMVMRLGKKLLYLIQRSKVDFPVPVQIASKMTSKSLQEIATTTKGILMSSFGYQDCSFELIFFEPEESLLFVSEKKYTYSEDD